MRTLLTTSLATLLFASSAASADATLQSQLEDLHQQWFTAFDKGDGATMDKLETPNLMLVFGDGAIWHKTGPRTGKQKPTQVVGGRRLTNSEVRQYGDAAILTGQLETGADHKDVSATTVVFVRTGGQWLIASAQWSSSGK